MSTEIIDPEVVSEIACKYVDIAYVPEWDEIDDKFYRESLIELLKKYGHHMTQERKCDVIHRAIIFEIKRRRIYLFVPREHIREIGRWCGRVRSSIRGKQLETQHFVLTYYPKDDVMIPYSRILSMIEDMKQEILDHTGDEASTICDVVDSHVSDLVPPMHLKFSISALSLEYGLAYDIMHGKFRHLHPTIEVYDETVHTDIDKYETMVLHDPSFYKEDMHYESIVVPRKRR